MYPEVSIIRDHYTSRSGFLEDRGFFRFNFSIKVRDDSLLLVAAGAQPRQIIPEKYISRVDSALKRADFENELKRIVSSLEYEIKQSPNIRTQVTLLSRPVIPGNTLKGVSRSRLEYMFKPKKQNGILQSYACYIVGRRGQYAPKRHKEFWGEDNVIFRESCKSTREVCIVCDIYGMPGLSSRVEFSDAYFDPSCVKEFQSSDYGRVRAIKPGSVGTFSIKTTNFSLIDSALLLASLGQFSGNAYTPIGFYKYKFNPRVGETSPYENKFFGLVSFELKSVKKFNGSDWVEVETKEFADGAAKELQKSKYNEFLDRGVGWIK